MVLKANRWYWVLSNIIFSFICFLIFYSVLLFYQTARSVETETTSQKQTYRLFDGVMPDLKYDDRSNLGQQTDKSALDDYIVERMNNYHISGVSACAIKGDSIIWSGSYGYANREKWIETTDSTIFMMASISKTITGSALMQLWENGAFALDDDINDYMPINIYNPYFPELPITFRQLMAHTSNLDDNWDVMNSTYCQGDSPIPLDEYVAGYFLPGGVYYDSVKNFHAWQPETIFEYCNHGFVMIGYLVYAISGIPFNQYCTDSIFNPLGMNETSFFIADLDTNKMAMPYHYGGFGYEPLGHFSYADYPAGALRTSSLQLARHLIAFKEYGVYDSVRILDSATIALMRSIQYPEIYSGIGLVWFRENRGGRWVWGHGGGDQGVSTYYGFCVEENIGAVVLTNGESYSGTSQIYNEVMNYAAALSYDYDGDSIPDSYDNCPTVVNPDQIDSDNDGFGDLCDNCPTVPNPPQSDLDGDAIGDYCDNCYLDINPLQEDYDSDSFGDSCDNCITTSNTNQTDSDDDTIGDACDNCIYVQNLLQEDFDSDNVGDSCDNCLQIYNPDQTDSDLDSIGDSCDFICGDINNDETVNIFDITGLIAYLYQEGVIPQPVESADVNGDIIINIFDITYLINYLYKSGPEPSCL